MGALLRPVAYAAGALAGVYLVDRARPVDARAAADGGLRDIPEISLAGLQHAGETAAGLIKGQVRSNIILGVVVGCAAVGALDYLVG